MLAQWSAYSGRSSSRSTSRARFSGAVSARNVAGLLRSRQASDHIERGTAEEGGITGGLRRRDPQPLELGPDVAVDEVGPRQTGIERGGNRARQRDHDLAAREQSPVPRRDRRLAGDRAGLDQPTGLDGDDGTLARLERGQVRHVLGPAVRIMRRHHQPLCRPPVHDPLGRRDTDPHQRRRVGRGPRCAAGDPAQYRLVSRRAALEPPASPVRHGRRRLQEQQALLGSRRKDPPPARLAGHRIVVEGGVEAQQRELEPILPRDLPWHAPALHPARVRIGKISRSSVTGNCCRPPRRAARPPRAPAPARRSARLRRTAPAPSTRTEPHDNPATCANPLPARRSNASDARNRILSHPRAIVQQSCNESRAFARIAPSFRANLV